MNKHTILFDLDGTLTDPKEGIGNSYRHALKAFGLTEDNEDTLASFIGPPLRDVFSLHYGLSPEDTERAVSVFREYFTRQGILENRLYQGIPELLNALKAQGKTILLATSKVASYAVQILDHFGISRYFSFVAGDELSGVRTSKGAVIRHALERMNITDTTGLIMVGDRKHDVLGAKEFAMENIGVLYGYGSEDELRKAGADYITDSVASLSGLLLGSC